MLLPVLLLAGMLGASAKADVSFTPLFSCSTNSGTSPNTLLKGLDGNLYGAMTSGGSNGNYGTIFQCSTSGSFSNIYAFSATNGVANSAIQPLGLLQNPDGTFVGTSFGGGSYNYGMVFQLNTQGAFKVLHSFDRTNGAFPKSGAVLDTNDGNYYGTAFIGGTNSGQGTVYKLDTNGNYSTLFTFNGTNGGGPYAQLTVGADGNLYGTTYFGGANSAGSVFQISTNGSFSNLFSFDGAAYGAYPEGGLVQTADGFFYGTTSQGGVYGFGTIFRTDTNGNVSTVFSFNNTNGATPLSTLIQGRNGLLYGTTEYGGTNGNNGTIFSISTNGAFTSLYSFDGTNGSLPNGALVQTRSTTFFGAASMGGANNQGVIFQFNIIPPNPTLNISTDGSSVYINWNSVSGMTYQLQSNPGINSGWTNNGPVITATDTNTMVTNAAPATNNYYRVLVAPN